MGVAEVLHSDLNLNSPSFFGPLSFSVVPNGEVAAECRGFSLTWRWFNLSIIRLDIIRRTKKTESRHFPACLPGQIFRGELVQKSP